MTTDPSSGPPDGPALRRLDDAIVPRLQRLAGPLRRTLGAPAVALARLDVTVGGGRPARSAAEHRIVVAFVTVVVLFGAALVQFDRYPQLYGNGNGAARPAGGGSLDLPTSGGTGSLGPLQGARVDGYVEARRTALDAAGADEERVAVVSFDEFVTPAEAERLTNALERHAVQYQLPERTPRPEQFEVVADMSDELDAFLEDLLADIRREEGDTESTLPTVEDPDFIADYEARLDELRGLRNTLTNDPRIVFAVVISGRVADMRELGAQPGVRLVDLAPPDVDPDTMRMHGILPTDQDRFTFGRTR